MWECNAHPMNLKIFDINGRMRFFIVGKFNSKKLKVAVAVALCSVAVSTTALASWQLLNFNSTGYETIVSAVKKDGVVDGVLTAAQEEITALKNVVSARSSETKAVQNAANSQMSSVNTDIDSAASSASDLEKKASALQASITADSSSVSSATTADTEVVYVDSVTQ